MTVPKHKGTLLGKQEWSLVCCLYVAGVVLMRKQKFISRVVVQADANSAVSATTVQWGNQTFSESFHLLC